MNHYTPRAFELMRIAYSNALTRESLIAESPEAALRLPLRAHQRAVLHEMDRLERELTDGMDCSGELFYSTYGILGDSVGVGKSLMVLGHIARMSQLAQIPRHTTVGSHSNPGMFSVHHTACKDRNQANSLILVPHTLFRQWVDYIKKQTHLKAYCLDKRNKMASETFLRDILEADLVLVSNTLYKEFSFAIEDAGIRWKRAFIDEADTIHIPSTSHLPKARFTWFITATWMNLLFPNETLYITNTAIATAIFQEGSPYTALRSYFLEAYQSNRSHSYFRFYLTSFLFYKGLLNSAHKLRSRVIVQCDPAFIQESISLPPLTQRTILCKAPLTQRIVNDFIPREVQELLHGGDTRGALQALGLKTEDAVSLVDAVTKNLQKELERHRATYQFKSALEYSSPAAKETALKSLEEKIARTQQQITSIQERIQGFKGEMCPICYDDAMEAALLTPCCSRIFCGQCILTCLTRAKECPMCRASILVRGLTKVVTTEEKNEIVESGGAEEPVPEALERKSEALLRVMREHPTGRFLVFSRYDNPFFAMEESLAGIGVRVKQVKGNKDAVAATLRSFQSGDLRCLLLNSHNAGSGLNITSATHVILYHAMTHEEEKQIMGRAYRMGRTEPLHVIRLLNENETVHTST